MNRLANVSFVFLLTGAALPAAAQHVGHHQPSPYAGQETRPVKSLSAEDIAELRRGGGWGLAKAAELNGYPGPAHLLELKDEVGLDAGQTAAVQALFDAMQAAAKAEGARYIALEEELEAQFRNRAVTEASLKAKLAEIATSREALRHIHLSAHLKTVAILTPEQVARYNSLRGYGATDVCSNVPAGHDPAMWKKHNGCG